MKPYKPSEAVEWLEQYYDVQFSKDACEVVLVNVNDNSGLPPDYVIHYLYDPPLNAPDYYTHIRTMIEVFPIHSACSRWGCPEYQEPW